MYYDLNIPWPVQQHSSQSTTSKSKKQKLNTMAATEEPPPPLSLLTPAEKQRISTLSYEAKERAWYRNKR